MDAATLIALGAFLVASLSFLGQYGLRRRIDELDLSEREARADLASRPELLPTVDGALHQLLIENVGGADACHVSLDGFWKARGEFMDAFPTEEMARLPLGLIRPNAAATFSLFWYPEITGPPLHLSLSWQDDAGKTYHISGPVEF